MSEMMRFVQGDSRTQSFLLPEALDDYVTDTNPVRVATSLWMSSIFRSLVLKVSSQR
jgi:hypothetical protein